MGVLPDHCVHGICNGVGLMQIVSAFDSQGDPLAHASPEWDGITNNVLTNITYSARVLAAKLAYEPAGLYELAFYYNGNPALRNEYAARVVEHYETMKTCAP